MNHGQPPADTDWLHDFCGPETRHEQLGYFWKQAPLFSRDSRAVHATDAHTSAMRLPEVSNW
ncbi:hypothetical protein C0Q70_03332 [Pomacea canaliculata]|uniref:Uncharacterized protein n=1 Tax=Pomacea canaliculata TaxID=400727 RepID=A0A2T7PSE6_POMCA|nr:hypothetical protein C0Q70_03332 [Pomacea canaliculata]